MPKVKQYTYDAQEAEFRAVLADRAFRRGINKTAIAEILCLTPCAARIYKQNPERITVRQLRRLIRQLEFTKDEIWQLLCPPQ